MTPPERVDWSAGWLHRRRSLSRVSFLVLRDRSGLAQIVLEREAHLAPETVLEVRGRAVANDQAPGGVEVHDAELTVIAAPVEPPPVELHQPEPRESLPVRLDHAPVALRHPLVRERFRLTARAIAAFRATLGALDFTEIQSPRIVGAATEGGANVFRLDYFGRDAFLAQSPQFYKQIMVGVFERVFETGPVFRAEPHETARHLAEYVSLDAELGFIGDHRDVMDVVARCVRAMIAAVGQPVPESIPVVHFTDVRRGDEPDLAPDRGLEIVSGGQRLHRYKDYLAALAARDLDLAPFAGYLDAFRSGMPPHGGFGLGLERFMAQATGVRNVREVTLFPRDRTRLSP